MMSPTREATLVTISMNGSSLIREVAAVVSDLDGVLTDTETYFFRAVNALLTEEDISILSDHETIGLVGLDNESLWDRLRAVRPLGLGLAEYTSRVDTIAQAIYAREMKPAEGAIDLLESVRAEGVPLGLATSGEMAWVANRLNILGISEAFDTVVTGDRTFNPKPDPEVYQTAARELNVSPEDVLALEDSPIGIRAARSAGMFTVAVRTDWTQKLDISEADAVVNSLRDVTFGQPAVRSI
jgi:HAD superfamily hydrolase (TIGR01509 family)